VADPTFYEVLSAAIAEISETGYTSAERLKYWQDRLAEAANRSLKAPAEMQRMLQEALYSIYRKLVERDGWLKYHPGVDKFGLDRVRANLRTELDRRILASADLIKLHRERAIAQTLQRFSGWATSIPIGGSAAPEKVATKVNIRKALAQLPFEDRRVLIDQGHKLVSSINDVIAVGNGAIAGIWHSHGETQPGYNYRPDHLARARKVYAIRGCWAIEKGLMKVGPAGYTDQITQPGEEVYCRCFYTYLYNLGSLPDDMVTKKGRDILSSVKAEMAQYA
jgi:hypothetical protein